MVGVKKYIIRVEYYDYDDVVFLLKYSSTTKKFIYLDTHYIGNHAVTVLPVLSITLSSIRENYLGNSE